MSIDRYKILSGTLEKRFAIERRALTEDYDQSSASDFKYVYKDAPLSFILNHSRDIFSETWYGYPFYLDIIRHVIIPPTRYALELSKVSVYVEEARKKSVPKEQLEKYESLQDLLSDQVDAYSHIADIIRLVEQSDNGPSFLQIVFDGLYDIRLCEKKYEDNEKPLGHTRVYRDYIAEAIFTSPSPYAAVGLGLLITMKYEEYASCLYDLTTRFLNPIKEPDRYGVARRGINAIKHMMKSGFVVEALRALPSRVLLEKWVAISGKGADALLPIPVEESAIETPAIAYDGSNISDLEMFIESMENDPKHITTRYDMYRYNVEKLDADRELSDKDVNLQENFDDLQDEYEAQVLMLEWEDDGSPNKIIQNHIMTSKERAAAEEAKKKEKKSPINNLEAENDKTDKEDETETELCGKIKKSIEVASKLTPADTDEEKANNNEVLSALRSDCKKYKEIIDKNDYKSAKKLYDELREEILAADSDSTNEEFGADTDAMLKAFLESDDSGADTSDSDDDEDDEKSLAHKPKQDFATKVQNKALDYAAKDNEKLAESREARQKLKNAANAVSQKPRRQVSGLKEFVNNFNKWDENRRKKFMLKPGFRHKIFKHMRNAIMLGVAAQTKLALIPMMGLIAHISKQKDDRIRTELTRELENEIKICEEKINDANSDGDKDSKYELMRIKDKLEAEKIRVKLNSKYI